MSVKQPEWEMNDLPQRLGPHGRYRAIVVFIIFIFILFVFLTFFLFLYAF